MQSSITAWLKKPASVKQAPSATIVDRNTAIDDIESARDSLPTPPPESLRAPPPQESDSLQHDLKTETSSCPAAPAPATANAKPHPTFSLSNEPKPLVPNLTLEPCTRATLSSFKRLNALLLQIPYPTKFYDEIITDPVTASLTLLATWRDTPSNDNDNDNDKSNASGRVVAGIRCRLLGGGPTNGIDPTASPILYISTLVVLSPYRHYGLATHLLERVTRVAVERYGAQAVGAHVWVDNAEGRAWYAKRGFREERVEDGYYRRLDPSGAVVVKRKIGVGDLLGRG